MQRKHIITKCCLRKVDANCQKNYTPPKNKFAKNGTHIHSWKRKIAIFDNNWLRTWIHVRHCLPACQERYCYLHMIFSALPRIQKRQINWLGDTEYTPVIIVIKQWILPATIFAEFHSAKAARLASISQMSNLFTTYSIWENVLILIIHFIFRFDHEKIP